MASSIHVFVLIFITVTSNTQQPISATEINLCSTDQLVIRLSLEQLVDLVSKWAAEKRLPTAVVLKQLENRLETSTDSKFPQHIVMPSSGIPPPFAMKPPMDTHRSELRTLQPMRNPPLPDNVVVRIKDVASAEVTISPRMSVVEALRLAFAALTDKNNRSYKINWKKNKNRKCYTIRSVGGLTSNVRSKWVVAVTDKNHRKIWRDTCLPSLNQVQLRPGNIITLAFLSRDRQI